MRRIAIGLIAAILAILCEATAAQPVALTDDRGRGVTLDRPAIRIVSLAPHLTEIAFAAGAGAALVGVSAYSDFPGAAKRLPVVSAAGAVSFETVAALKPDLVLAWVSGNRPADLERLEAMGVKVFATESRRLDDVARVLRLVGRLAGTEAVANARAAAVEADLASLRAQYSARAAVRAFYAIWHEPPMTVSDAHAVGDAMRLCGARNVFGAEAPLTPVISREALIGADPDAILVGVEEPHTAAAVEAWQRLRALRAVREGRVYVLDASLMNRMGPRIVDGVRELCAAVDRARTRSAP